MTNAILYTANWTTTANGNSVELYQKIHSQDSCHILFVGGVHGDEPEGVILAEKLLEWLQQNETPHSWALVPCLNKDGYIRNTRTNMNGVDLNRNFPTADWVPTSKGPRYYPGSKPASELEVQALCQLIQKIKPDLIIHFHSWEPSITYTGTVALPAVQILSQESGYQIQDDIGYPTPGSLGQYGWLNLKTPVICIEAQEKSDLKTVWPQFQKGLVRLMTEHEWADSLKALLKTARISK